MRVEKFRTKTLVHKRQEQGFSLLQLVVALAIIGIVVAFATLSIARARASMRMQKSVRVFAGYVEKARLDAIRRHTGTSIDITGSNTYDIFMDFNGTGNPTTRRFTLEEGVVFTDANNATLTVDVAGNVTCPNGDPVPWADFDYRGRTTECTMLFRLKNSNNETTSLQVMGSGDVTVDSAVSTPANVNYSTVNASDDVVTTATVNGSIMPNNLSPCGTTGGGGGGGGAGPVGTCAGGGTISPNPGFVSIRRNGGSTATVNVTVNQAGTITATPNSNLSVTPTTLSVTSSSGGTFSFTISSITRNRTGSSLFSVGFSNPCSSTSVQVKVTN